ncbi:M56 family metallopeptidase [Neobacillus niacini]|uniref:M56 family metallopeptidase n=1 Tax=Neobacillus niacini TaxID=86668 RepID=UPI0007ABCC00|nr:M56 family metallopeptidase [Neobacillus niacini]MEC1525633.1 M56 family metallopeptidase [Neobacillus niacini]
MIDIFLDIYLPRLFDWVIETSIMASILVALILGVKILLKNKLTPRWHYLLWMILIVRLILPWSPGSSFSIFSILSISYEKAVPVQSKSVVSLENELIQETTSGISGTRAVTEEGRYPTAPQQTTKERITDTPISPSKKQKEESISFYTIALYIWLTGVMVLGFVTCLINLQLYRYIKQQPVIIDKRIFNIFENCKKSMSIQQSIPLLLAGKISSPTVLGFFRPRILLSDVHISKLTDQQLRHIFYHELAHIKRRDVGVNWLMHSLLILNWFNPILWCSYVFMREDQELACDACALTFMEEEEKTSYGLTIISLLEHYSHYYQIPSLANLSRNKRTLKRRILMIKKFQKKSYGWSMLGIVAVMIISSLSLLNAHADDSNVKQERQAETRETATAEAESNEFNPRMKQFIAEQAEELKNTNDRYEYNAKIEQLVSEFANQYTGYSTVEAAYDFENLRRLIQWGSIINFSFQEGTGGTTAEQIVQGMSVFEYLKQLLNDLDVVINKNGKGNTYGVLHQLDGEHVIELEKHVYGEQGFPAELKEYYIENYNKIVEVESSRIDPSAKLFIARQAKEFKNTTDINEYLSNIQQIMQEYRKQSPLFNTVEDNNDFANLGTLLGAGALFKHSISYQKQQGIETVEYSDDLKRIFEYTKQLLNDLDVVMNKNGKGDTFGVSHQLNGEHVKELEKFLNGEN